MIDFHEQNAADIESDETGRWVTDCFRDGAAVRIRSTRSRQGRAAQKRIDARCHSYLRRGVPLPATAKHKNELEMAVAVVADWKGILSVDGAPVACTVHAKHASFRRMSTEPGVRRFVETVIGCAFRMSNSGIEA